MPITSLAYETPDVEHCRFVTPTILRIVIVFDYQVTRSGTVNTFEALLLGELNN
jgi:hypothetical protein